MHSFLQEYGSLLMVFAACTGLFLSGLISNNRERARQAKVGVSMHPLSKNSSDFRESQR